MMYIRIESGEIIEFHDPHPPESGEMSRDDDGELYEKLYGSVGVKPVDGTPSWQLFAMRMNRDGASSWQFLSAQLDDDGKEICIATFDTLEDASDTLDSFKEACCRGRRWDATAYKKSQINKVSLFDHLYFAKLLAKPVTELELSVRALNCLEIANIKTIREIVMKKESDLLGFKHIGLFSVSEIKQQLANKGLTFGVNLDSMTRDSDIEEENDDIS